MAKTRRKPKINLRELQAAAYETNKQYKLLNPLLGSEIDEFEGEVESMDEVMTKYGLKFRVVMVDPSQEKYSLLLGAKTYCRELFQSNIQIGDSVRWWRDSENDKRFWFDYIE